MKRAQHALDGGKAFPSYFIAPTVPVWDAKANGPWMLEVSGMVAKPMRFSLADLQRMPSVTQRINHYCVEGWQAIASWTGVRLRDVAARWARIRRRGTSISSRSTTGTTRAGTSRARRIRRRWSRTAWTVRSWRRPRRPGAHPFARQTRLQEHQVPDPDRVHARAERRVLERSGLRVVRRHLGRIRVLSSAGRLVTDRQRGRHPAAVCTHATRAPPHGLSRRWR